MQHFQMVGDSISLGTSFFHLSGMYPVLLAAVYGVTVHCLSDYSDKAFLSMIRDTRSSTAALYPWQVPYQTYYEYVVKNELLNALFFF